MNGVSSVIPVLRELACPCRFPRFVHLVGFNFQDFGTGPVASLDSEELVLACYHGPAAFLQQKSERQIQDSTCRSYTCGTCFAEWDATFTDYSISFYRSYLRLCRKTYPDVGAAVQPPLPFVSGFRYFKEADVKQCAALYKQVTLAEFIRYVREVGHTEPSA